MLSRSNSNAGERLRRAKSTSSTHTSSSGHQRTHTSIDPFVTRQQAEVAALEAYHRARAQEDPAYPVYRPVPPKLQRRHSQVTGKTEGGHLEDARLGRRKSNSRKGNASGTKPVRFQQQQQQQQPWPSNVTDESTGDEIKIRRRYVVPPNLDVRASQYDNFSLPASSRYARRSEPGYTEGSPLPRNSTTLRERGSTIDGLGHDGYLRSRDGSSIAHIPDRQGCDDLTMRSGAMQKAATHETQMNGESLSLARDKCLQDFHHHKLRDRKSFILAPFQKRRATTSQTNDEAAFDTKLPPFNYAESFMPPPPPPPPSATVPSSLTIKNEKKSRNFSDSLKGRLKKVFRKSSRAPSGVPAQHIEAKRFHYTQFSSLQSSEIGAEDDPFRDAADQDLAVAAECKTDSMDSRTSTDAQSTAKSRVTSWTNSTAAGTWSTRNGMELEELVEEHEPLRRSDSVSTLRKASSFFGRPIKSRLRRPSKAELQSSEESHGLYSALQERIKPGDATGGSPDSKADVPSTTTSALATLPSQQKAESITSSARSWTAPTIPTIRSVTPEPSGFKLDIPSPVTEILSPDASKPLPRHPTRQATEDADPTPPQIQLQRRRAIKAPTPSKDLIAHRVEKSKNRWQSPLNEFSPPPASISIRAAMMDDNPYELRSLSRTLQQQPLTTSSDIPHHAKVSESMPAAGRQELFSPSVYSCGTDGESPRRDTPVDKGDMMVTITSREVRSYSLSPPKRNQREVRPVQESGEWRRWLSGEMNGLRDYGTSKEFELSETVLPDVGRMERNFTQNPRGGDLQFHRGLENTSVLSLRTDGTDGNVVLSHSGKEYLSRDDGCAAVVETIPTSKETDDRAKRRDECGESTGERVVPHGRPSFEGGEILGINGLGISSTIATQKSLTSSKSTTHLLRRGKEHAASITQQTNNDTENTNEPRTNHLTTNLTNSSTEDRNGACKPKSAFDLRANYKDTSSGVTKPLAVRRRSNKKNNKLDILEDTTIRNISAGPYASQLQQAPPLPTTAIACPAPEANKENTPPLPPTPELNSLPVLPSSEWLAAGTNRKREGKSVLGAHAQSFLSRSRSVSRLSPAATITRDEMMPIASDESSPGQRLVTHWLDGKRVKENSPAFV